MVNSERTSRGSKRTRFYLSHMTKLMDAKAYVKRFTVVPETFVDVVFEMMSE